MQAIARHHRIDAECARIGCLREDGADQRELDLKAKVNHAI